MNFSFGDFCLYLLATVSLFLIVSAILIPFILRVQYHNDWFLLLYIPVTAAICAIRWE